MTKSDMVRPLRREQTRTRLKKARMLKALKEANGLVSTAVYKSEISRETYYRWLKEDPVFAEEVDILEEKMLDFAEGKLFSLIGQGNVRAIIFFLRTRGKKRGYTERVEQEHVEGIDYTFKLVKTVKNETEKDSEVRANGVELG